MRSCDSIVHDVEWVRKADKNLKNHQPYYWCKTCKNWRWQDELCLDAKTDKQTTRQRQIEDVLD